MRVKIGDCRLFFDVEGLKLRPDGPRMRDVPTLLLLHGGPGYDHSTFKPSFKSARASETDFTCSPIAISRIRRRFGCRAALARLDAGEHTLVETIDGIDVALGAWIVRDHHDRLLELAIHVD